jgi:hypothetical protein
VPEGVVFHVDADVPGAVVVLGPVSGPAAPRPVDEHVDEQLVVSSDALSAW